MPFFFAFVCVFFLLPFMATCLSFPFPLSIFLLSKGEKTIHDKNTQSLGAANTVSCSIEQVSGIIWLCARKSFL